MRTTMIEIKIGRHTYEITERDQFMDNGHCVLLLTQSQETISWGVRYRPVLSKRAIKEISKFERKSVPNKDGSTVGIFWLVAPT